MKKLLIYNSEKELIKEYDLNEGEYTIGRSKENNIHLTTRDVSRVHAKITITPDSAYIEDLESTHGLILNGNKEKKILLENSSQFELASYIIEYQCDPLEDLTRVQYQRPKVTPTEITSVTPLPEVSIKIPPIVSKTSDKENSQLQTEEDDDDLEFLPDNDSEEPKSSFGIPESIPIENIAASSPSKEIPSANFEVSKNISIDELDEYILDKNNIEPEPELKPEPQIKEEQNKNQFYLKPDMEDNAELLQSSTKDYEKSESKSIPSRIINATPDILEPNLKKESSSLNMELLPISESPKDTQILQEQLPVKINPPKEPEMKNEEPSKSETQGSLSESIDFISGLLNYFTKSPAISLFLTVVIFLSCMTLYYYLLGYNFQNGSSQFIIWFYEKGLTFLIPFIFTASILSRIYKQKYFIKLMTLFILVPWAFYTLLQKGLSFIGYNFNQMFLFQHIITLVLGVSLLTSMILFIKFFMHENHQKKYLFMSFILVLLFTLGLIFIQIRDEVKGTSHLSLKIYPLIREATEEKFPLSDLENLIDETIHQSDQ